MTAKKKKSRCMTCDKLMDSFIYLELTEYESIGICFSCLSVIRTFNAFQDEAHSEWAKMMRRAPENRVSYATTATRGYKMIRRPQKFVPGPDVFTDKAAPIRKKLKQAKKS